MFSNAPTFLSPVKSLYSLSMASVFLAAIVVLIGSLSIVSATLGVDVSQRTDINSWACLKESGYSFAVVRVYCSSGVVDSNGPETIKDAWAGGMDHVDGYIFPCFSCGNAAQQMDDTINNLSANNATVGMLWLDVEGTQYWSSSASSNVAFLQQMADQGVARGVSLGVYTSNSQWTPIMGGSTQFSQFPLWYPHYESTPNPSYSDFTAFGGWSTPSIKQYQGTSSICSASVDFNYY